MTDRTHIERLLQAYLRDELAEADVRTLFELLRIDANLSLLEEALDAELRSETPDGPSIRKLRLKEIEQAILDRSQPIETVTRLRPRWIRIAASVVLAVAAGWAAWQLFESNVKSDLSTRHGEYVEAPSRNRAVLSLGDKQHVYLDSARDRVLATHSSVLVERIKDGELVYHSMDAAAAPAIPEFHSLSNPRGSRLLEVTLTDGTKITLNAGSAVRYQVPFDKDRRLITVDGEAFFEVAPHTSWPMVVRHGEMDVQVLGTTFNVNAYEDANQAVVTLVEGSVRVDFSEAETGTLLRPGFQAIWNSAQQDLSTSAANLRQTLAWREGRFDFENKTFDEAMKEIARWYDVEVVYTDQVPQIVFFGDMHRNTSLNGILQTLEIFGVKAIIKDQKLLLEYKRK